MTRFVPVAAAMLLAVITAMGFSSRNQAKEQPATSATTAVGAASTRSECEGSCDELATATATATTGSCLNCDELAQHGSTGKCCLQAREEGSCSTDQSASAYVNCDCAAEQSAKSLAGHGPPWARGQQAGRGKQGGGMGQGKGQSHMGCGMVLRNAINNGKIDEQLVNSLLFGPRGNAARGKQVFEKNCSVCHKLGHVGTDIAPDLTNRPRHNPVYVLANLSHPSAIIPQQYQVLVVVTDAGKVITGFKVEENAKAITILDATNQRTVIPRHEIETVTISEKSLMPENLVETLGEEQLRDLLSFLRS